MRCNLAGTFRVGDKEYVVMNRLSGVHRMSVNQIAEIMGRSTSTVHKWVKPKNFDNRRNSDLSRRLGVWNFKANLPALRMKLKAYFMEIIGDLDAALDDKMKLPSLVLAYLANENSSEEEDEDPA